MSLKKEIEVFDHINISPDTGETDVWDRVIFPNVIRKREIELVMNLVRDAKPERILDFGCGSGWLSRLFTGEGYKATGIDTSGSLIRNAKKSSAGSTFFLVGDCMNLPFKDEAFDMVVGVAILHHLQADKGLAECYRVLCSGGRLLLLEPNKHNPIAALARKMTPVDTQTPDERPLSPRELKNLFNPNSWSMRRITYLFPYSAGISQILRRIRIDKPVLNFLCPPIRVSEAIYERIPLLNSLCWVIGVEAQKADF